jgi:hypothetical protein
VDFNNDEILDIIVGDRDGFINFFRGTATATLTTMPDITAGGVAIDVGANSAPVVTDWNEDGLLDLVIGSETGTIRLYLNSGTPTSHSFTTFSLLQSGGTSISWYRACPQVIDLDGDGKKDLLVGENNGKIAFYANTGTNAAPAFSGYQFLKSGGVDIDLYSGTRLCVEDWDEDGILDLLASDYNGWVYLYLGSTVGVEEGTWGVVSPETGILISGSPTSGTFQVDLSLETVAEVTGRIYSSDGRLVGATEYGPLSGGQHVLSYDLEGNSPGVYFVSITAGSAIMDGRVVLLP